ncbi:MAG: LPS export ABC transporter periplasmic protein LptC [Gammaproteobacteria bacterium]
MIKQHYLLIMVIFCMIAVSVWLQQTSPPGQPPTTTEQSIDAGYDHFITNAYWTNWNDQGQADHYLSATRMEHFPARQGSVLQHPELITSKHRKPSWAVTANTAWLPDANPVIQLDNHVVATTRLQSGTVRKLYTEQMRVDTRQMLAQSDLPVRIESISGIVTGTGFHADLNTQRMELHNQVRSKHEDNKN